MASPLVYCDQRGSQDYCTDVEQLIVFSMAYQPPVLSLLALLVLFECALLLMHVFERCCRFIA